MQSEGREKYREKELSKSKDKSISKQPSGLKACSNCGHKNESEANFCEECGTPFGGHNCPNCKAEVLPGQDICEACGAWILTGQCKFCYSPISPEDKFCGECGNPTEGIKCPKCNTLNYFDFCSNCHEPLTDEALAEIEKSKNDPDLIQVRNFISELEEIEQELQEASQVSEADLMRQKLEEEMAKEEEQLRQKFNEVRKLKDELKDLLPPSETSKQPSGQPSKPKPKENKFNKLKDSIKQRESQREQLLKRIQDKLNEMQSKTFENPQAARRFFIANRPPGNYVWNCNFNDSIHPDPNNCGSPEKGGKWIIEYGEIQWRTHHGEC